MKFLIVEDDPTVLATLRAAVAYGGFESESAMTGEQALFRLASESFDLVLLDLGLPDVQGVKLVELVRGLTLAPIIVVSGYSTEQDTVKSLDAGADDFVSKPFFPGVLLAKVRAALRRRVLSGTSGEEPWQRPLRVGPLTLNPVDRSVSTTFHSVTFSKSEYRLLTRLVADYGAILSRVELARGVPSRNTRPNNKIVDVYLVRIRKALADLLPGQKVIHSIAGKGWTFRIDQQILHDS